MIDPNKGCSQSVLKRLQDASNERFRIELFKAIEKLLEDFDMTWDDLAWKYGWNGSGASFKTYLGDSDEVTLKELNKVAAVFSSEPYIIFRPRKPWTGT